MPYRDRKDRNPERVDGTCEWFTNHLLFRTWQESRTSSLLWVSADPGCGKSVLAKYLVDDVLPSTGTRTTCYFFFKDDFDDQRSPAIALCCILRQLFDQKPAVLSDKIFEKFEAGGENLTGSFRDLWDILISIASDRNAGEILCILDALDECEENGRSQIAGALHELCWPGTSKFTLKFLLTSRPHVYIQRDFQTLENRLPAIHLSGENQQEVDKISREIDIFIRKRVKDLGEMLLLLAEEEQILQDELTRVPNRTYLWVYLIFDMIKDSIDITEDGLRADIRRVPKTVEAAYDKILCRSRDWAKAKRLLHIVVAAERPLSLKEMALALAIKESHQTYADLKLKPEGRFRKTVRELCGLFVTIIDSKIYLLHQTAREFLVKKFLDAASNPDRETSNLQWKFSLRPVESHRILAEICIWHLLFTEFEAYPLGEKDLISRYTTDYIFLHYSANHWAAHSRKAQIKMDAAMLHSILSICDPASKRAMTWSRIYWTTTGRDFPTPLTALMVTSYFGLEGGVKLLLENDDFNLNSMDGIYGRTSLSWAAENGHKAVVKLLLDKGADTKSKDSQYGWTPLFWAASNGHKAIVKLLLDNGADIELKDSQYGQTPLLWAAANGYKAIVELLLDKGADAESKDNKYGQTPLLWATKNVYEAIVKLLLDKGADTESKDNKYGQTPLLWATKNQYEAIVKLLLDKGADTEAKDSRNGRTPLLWAAEKGHKAIIKLLLDKGADIESKNNFGWTPLSLAAGNGQEAAVKLLLKKGAEIESKDIFGRTPLLYAIANKHETIITLLQSKP